MLNNINPKTPEKFIINEVTKICTAVRKCIRVGNPRDQNGSSARIFAIFSLDSGINTVKPLADILLRCNRVATCLIVNHRNFHVTPCKQDKLYNPEERFKGYGVPKKGWLAYNDVVYPPTKEGEAPRPAEICHQRDNILMSAKKFWYAAVLVRGLSIDEAIKQCDFNKKVASKIVKEVLLEAQEMATMDFNVEFKSNLWIADSFVEKTFSMPYSVRRTRKSPQTIVQEVSTYCVRLREGRPPKEYYAQEPTGNEKLEEYIRGQRKRRIMHSL